MSVVSYPALAISLAALVISLYTLLERRGAARRAERLRFAVIVDDLNNLQLEHVRAAADGDPGDDLVAAINARRELLCSQALPMVTRFRRELTSPEFRSLAFALNRAGYVPEAEEAWRDAVGAASGPTQKLFAHRGYAYFLFAEGRVAEARAGMTRALSAVDAATDTARVHRVETLVFWAEREEATDPAGEEAAQRRGEAAAVAAEIEAAGIRRRMSALVDSAGTGHGD